MSCKENRDFGYFSWQFKPWHASMQLRGSTAAIPERPTSFRAGGDRASSQLGGQVHQRDARYCFAASPVGPLHGWSYRSVGLSIARTGPDQTRRLWLAATGRPVNGITCDVTRPPVLYVRRVRAYIIIEWGRPHARNGCLHSPYSLGVWRYAAGGCSYFIAVFCLQSAILYDTHTDRGVLLYSLVTQCPCV